MAKEEVVNLQESVSTSESKTDLVNTSTVMPNADVSSKKVRCAEDIWLLFKFNGVLFLLYSSTWYM